MNDSFNSLQWQQYLLYPGTVLMAKVQNAVAFNHPASQNGTQPSSGAAPYYQSDTTEQLYKLSVNEAWLSDRVCHYVG